MCPCQCQKNAMGELEETVSNWNYLGAAIAFAVLVAAFTYAKRTV